MDKNMKQKEFLRRKYTSIHSEQHSEKYQIGNFPAMMIYMDPGFKNSFTSTTDWLSKGIDP